MARERQSKGAEKTCVICAARFYVGPSRQRNGPALTCSLKCRGAWQKQQPRKSTSRDSAAYNEWRAAVYRRDDYTCQRCGKRGGHDLHAHHIKYWADYPELRFDAANGLLLCASCHAREHFNVSVLQRSRAT
jgi:5-methylcytosine-specific restriction endonuclease McrA